MEHFDRIEGIFEHIMQHGYITVEDHRNRLIHLDQSEQTLSKMIHRDFDDFLKMYSIDINSFVNLGDIIVRKKGILECIEDGYRFVLNNHSQTAKKDFLFRYEYLRTKNEVIKKQLLGIIIENLQDTMVALEHFQNFKNDAILKTINEAIVKNKQISIQTSNQKKFILEPIKVYYHLGYWYLCSFVADHDYENRIKLNNIKKINLRDNDITTDKEKLATHRAYTYDAWGHEKSQKQCKIILQLSDRNIYEFFRVKKFKINQTTYIKSNNYFVEFMFNYPNEIVHILFAWMNYITISDIICQNNQEESLLKYLKDSIENFLNKAEHQQYFQ